MEVVWILPRILDVPERMRTLGFRSNLLQRYTGPRNSPFPISRYGVVRRLMVTQAKDRYSSPVGSQKVLHFRLVRKLWKFCKRTVPRGGRLPREIAKIGGVTSYFDNRGLSYAEEGDYDRGVIDYDEAIRISPRANFLVNRGNAYQAKGDLSRAIADYDRAIQLNPAFADAYNNRGAAFRGKGDLDRAIADYQAALRIDPRFETAAENLAAVQALRKRAMR